MFIKPLGNYTISVNASGNQVYVKGGTLFTGWNHWAIIVTPSTSYVYLNNVELAGTSSTSYDFILTKIGTLTGYQCNGTMADLRIYNRALSQTEITLLYNSYRPLTQMPSINESGLLLYLDAGNKSSYPGTGATWKDLANGYNVTLYNTSFSALNGGKLVFNGTTAYGQSAATPFTANTDFTISMWVKNIATSASCILFGNKGMSKDGEGVCFQYYHTTPLVYVLIKTSNSYYNYRAIMPWGTNWNQIVMTRSGTTVRGYLNGGAVVGPSTIAGTVTDQYNYFTIGAEPDLVPKCSEAVSQILVYQRALSAAEITQNYNATRGRFGL